MIKFLMYQVSMKITFDQQVLTSGSNHYELTPKPAALDDVGSTTATTAEGSGSRQAEVSEPTRTTAFQARGSKASRWTGSSSSAPKF